jgi:alcohol dehydrogenase
VVELGKGVVGSRVGDRVTVPFVAGCGRCEPCRSGNHQVCEAQSQPGFTHWGSFAELVRIRYADGNLVALPDDVDFVTAASLGCRFTTAYRAVVAQGRAATGEWVAVHGCGGVGLSAVMIARSLGARVLAIDVNPEALLLATSVGASATLRADESPDLVAEIVEATGGGPHLSVDALGKAEILHRSVASLRTRGRHVQVGLLVEDERDSKVPMARVVAKELEVIGSHGMQAALFPPLFDLMSQGELDPRSLVTRTCSLEEAAGHLAAMDRERHAGVTVIDRF